jgi:hypothetical protein
METLIGGEVIDEQFSAELAPSSSGEDKAGCSVVDDALVRGRRRGGLMDGMIIVIVVVIIAIDAGTAGRQHTHRGGHAQEN